MKGHGCTFLAKHAHWLLRLQLAGVFIFHGVQKFQNIQGFADMAKLPYAIAFLVALGEVGCPLLILLGGFKWDWLTRLGGFFLSVIMIGAVTMVHWGKWSVADGGMEYAMTLLAIALFFTLRGNGEKNHE